jgi:hypothetical protein
MIIRSIQRSRREKLVNCAPKKGARLKCLAPKLRPPEANDYIVVLKTQLDCAPWPQKGRGLDGLDLMIATVF